MIATILSETLHLQYRNDISFAASVCCYNVWYLRRGQMDFWKLSIDHVNWNHT